ncbi:MAG: type II toxin-antitoxin system VapC family toxin [Caldilineaceae bacterium]
MIEPQLVALQHFPNFTVVPITTIDLSAMHQNVRQFHLLPRDALHLSVMQRLGCTNLISEDSDFDTVDGVNRFTLQ